MNKGKQVRKIKENHILGRLRVSDEILETEDESHFIPLLPPPKKSSPYYSSILQNKLL